MNNKKLLEIRGGLIVDGSGLPPYTGDIFAENGVIEKIVKTGEAAPGPSGKSGSVNSDTETIDAAGKIVCPGFIDMHRHCDLAVFKEGFGALELKQGITSCFAGNCGMSPVPCAPESRNEMFDYLSPCLGTFEGAPFYTHAEYAEKLRRLSLPLNFGFFAGMGAVRIAVKGFDPSSYTKTEMESARSLFADALDAGAAGLSIGLLYVPELYSSIDETAAIAGVMKGRRGVLCAHIRRETEKLKEAVAEVIAIAKKAEVPLEISHFKAAGVKAWGRVLDETIGLIEKERAGGADITVDFYPYDCGSSTMMQMLPPSYLAGGIDKAVAGLNKQENVEKIRKLFKEGEAGWDNLSKTIGWERTIISSAALAENQKYIGKTVTEAAALSGLEDEAAFVARLLHSENGKAAIINRSMSQDDIDKIARLPYSSLISDSLYGDMKNPHPRLTGAFPRFLRDFVFERKILPLETAVRKMTAMPAARLGLKDRGVLAAGNKADILVFESGKFRDTSTFTSPAGEAAGLAFAFVDGVKVIEEGRFSGSGAGCLL